MDSNQYEHPAQWLLYDASGHSRAASSHNVPLQYVNTLQDDLLEYNSLYHVYHNFVQYETQYEDAYIELSDPGNSNEIAVLYHTGVGDNVSGSDDCYLDLFTIVLSLSLLDIITLVLYRICLFYHLEICLTVFGRPSARFSHQ